MDIRGATSCGVTSGQPVPSCAFDRPPCRTRPSRSTRVPAIMRHARGSNPFRSSRPFTQQHHEHHLCYPLVFLLVPLLFYPVHTAAFRGQAAAPVATSVSPDYYSALVTTPSSIFGEVTKAGPLPAERYDDSLFNHTAFREWLLQRVVFKANQPGPAPMSYKCGVFVNHHYRLIFIRNRKAASTTVLDTFKSACKTQSKLLCMQPFDAEELKRRGLTHDDMWRDYYVISSTRNPWARAASGFDYTYDRWPVKTGVCGTVTFQQFCLDPYLMGKMGNLFRCGTQNSFRGDDAWAYDFYHVEPAHHCLTTAAGLGGGLAVDFLIRYEHLRQDFAALLDVLNRRRPSSLPEIRAGRMRWMKQGVFVQAARDNLTDSGRGAAAAMRREDAAALVAADRHAVRYRECGVGCVNGIAHFFEGDLQTMQMQVPDPPPS